jgi:shikimate dehydrogenase
MGAGRPAERSRLAVLGSPIAHSKSPAIHRAAYAALGLDWAYSAVEVDSAALPGFLARLQEPDDNGRRWRGLSLTMPLKRDVVPHLSRVSPLVELVGGANTVLITDGGLIGTNTDVHGIVEALRGGGVERLDDVLVLGSGATAASVLAAAAALGAGTATVLARTPANAEPLLGVAEALAIELRIAPLHERRWGGSGTPDLVVSTLPGESGAAVEVPVALRRSVPLFDVAYDPWPSPLATAWSAVGGRVIPGIEMLLHQAVGQVRFFLTGDEETPLPSEPTVLDRMRESVGIAGPTA